MIDVDALFNNIDITEKYVKQDYTSFLTLPFFKVSKFKELLHMDALSIDEFNTAITLISTNNIDDPILHDILLRHSELGDDRPLCKIYKALHSYDANVQNLDIDVFNTNIPLLNLNTPITKTLLRNIWSDFTLMEQITESSNIDTHNPAQVILLSISKWWPDSSSNFIGLSALYEDYQLAEVFLNNIPSVETSAVDVLDYVTSIFN